MSTGGRFKSVEVDESRPLTYDERRQAGGSTDSKELQRCDRAFIVADITSHKLFGKALDIPDWFEEKFFVGLKKRKITILHIIPLIGSWLSSTGHLIW